MGRGWNETGSLEPSDEKGNHGMGPNGQKQTHKKEQDGHGEATRQQDPRVVTNF